MYLQNARELLHAHASVIVIQASSIYETEPISAIKQGDYLNQVIQVETDLPANSLLKLCQQIEKQLDRVREEKWGPRTIDLDILAFENEELHSKELILPHPRAHERLFVLLPWSEIAENHKLYGRPFDYWIEKAPKCKMCDAGAEPVMHQ